MINKTSLFIFLAVLCLFSSCDQGVNMHGRIEGGSYDGETAYLYIIKSEDFAAPVFLAQTTVEGGRFEFDDIQKNENIKEKELPTIAIVALYDLFGQKESDRPIGTGVLEEGTSNIVFEGTSVALSGTANSEKFNRIHQAIARLADLNDRTKEFGQIDNLPTDQEGRDGRSQLHDLNQNFKDVTFDFAKENMTNNMGKYIFYAYAENMFTPVQIKELIARSDSTFKDRKEIRELSNVLATMNEGLSDWDIKTVGESNDEIEQ